MFIMLAFGISTKQILIELEFAQRVQFAHDHQQIVELVIFLTCYPGLLLQVGAIDSLPEIGTNIKEWLNNIQVDVVDALLVTLFSSLLVVLYVRQRHRWEFAAALAPVPQLLRFIFYDASNFRM